MACKEQYFHEELYSYFAKTIIIFQTWYQWINMKHPPLIGLLSFNHIALLRHQSHDQTKPMSEL